MELLYRLLSKRGYKLTQFELAPLEFVGDVDESRDELLLDDVVASIAAHPGVVPLVRPMPTAGELQASIERHLHGSKDPTPPMDPADELRNALAELRRSLA